MEIASLTGPAVRPGGGNLFELLESIECKGKEAVVYIDGRKAHAMDVSGFPSGAVGFRVTGQNERGIFRRISLRKL